MTFRQLRLTEGKWSGDTDNPGVFVRDYRAVKKIHPTAVRLKPYREDKFFLLFNVEYESDNYVYKITDAKTQLTTFYDLSPF